MARYEVSMSIVSVLDVQFASTFWKRFHEDLGTKLYLSITYHL